MILIYLLSLCAPEILAGLTSYEAEWFNHINGSIFQAFKTMHVVIL